MRSNCEPCKVNSSLQPFEVGSYSFRLFVVSIANNRIRVERVAILSYALLKHTVQNRHPRIEKKVKSSRRVSNS